MGSRTKSRSRGAGDVRLSHSADRPRWTIAGCRWRMSARPEETRIRDVAKAMAAADPPAGKGEQPAL